MHKTILTVFIFFLISYSSFSQARFVFDDSVFAGGIFPVSSTIIKKNGIKKAMRYMFTDNKYTDSFLHTVSVFNAEGNLIENFHHTKKEGVPVATDTFIYDSRNRVTEQCFVRLGNKCFSKTITVYSGDSLQEFTDSIFATNFNPAKGDSAYSGRGHVSYQSKHFNGQHQLVEYIFYDGRHRPVKDIKYEYNENGEPQKISFYDKDGTLLYSDEYKYNFTKNGREMHMRHVSANKDREVIECDYNAASQCIHSYGTFSLHDVIYDDYTYNPDGTLFSCTTQTRLHDGKKTDRFYYFK